MRQGDRVLTAAGVGTVAYVRMAPPYYRVEAAVSVVLDARQGQPGYAGTIFAADDVRPVVEVAGAAGRGR